MQKNGNDLVKKSYHISYVQVFFSSFLRENTRIKSQNLKKTKVPILNLFSFVNLTSRYFFTDLQPIYILLRSCYDHLNDLEVDLTSKLQIPLFYISPNIMPVNHCNHCPKNSTSYIIKPSFPYANIII